MQFRSASIYAFALGAMSCVAGTNANAVMLNPRGTGQVLLFPYYTVNGGNDTLVSIVNTTLYTKAVRVRIAEGENGRDAYSVNVYLAPNDTWTAVLTRAGRTTPAQSDPVAALRSSDESCTVPAVASAGEIIGGGVALSSAAFSGANADAGDTAPTRVNEGSIEVFEMGTLLGDSPSAAAANPNTGRHCQTLVDAWGAGGYWTQNPATDLANPSGGLYGTAYVINVAKGTVFAYAATALDGFRSDPDDQAQDLVLHSSPGSAHPNLADAISDAGTHNAVAMVAANGRMVSATYPATRAIDAVSAALTAGTVDNEYTTNDAIGASTTFVFNYPTRRFYTDPAIVGAAAVAPFTSVFAGIRQNTVSELLPYGNTDLEGVGPLINCGVDLCANRLQSPGTSVEILNFGAGADALLASALDMSFDSPGSSPAAYSASGRMAISEDLAYLGGYSFPDPPPPSRYLRASSESKLFGGLPVIGFATLNLVNAHVQGGVLANYSAAIPLHTSTSCFRSTAGGTEHCT